MPSERFDSKLTAVPEADRRLMESIDNDLRRALSVEPSPDFAVRARASIGRDRTMRPAWSVYWGLAAAAALVAAIGLATFVIPRDGTRTGEGVTSAAVTGELPPETVLPPKGGSHGGPILPPRGGSHAKVILPPKGGRHKGAEDGRHRRVGREPAVLIDVRQREGLDGLLAAIRSGVRNLPQSLGQSGEGPVTAQDLSVAPVVVEPLQVSPLAASGGSIDTGAVRR
jgi:hypothetical protein